MPEFANPTLRRWELGNSLRRLREARGMTIAEVTVAMKDRYGSSFSTTKLSRMETAKRGVIPRDVHDLCQLYGVPEEVREHLVDLAKSSRASEDTVADDTNRGYRWLIAFEQIAVRVREYSAIFMPGLLQTAEYATAVENLTSVAPVYYAGVEPGEVPEDAADRVQLRLDRQALLERTDALQLHFVIDEGALLRRLASPEVMQGQLERLLAASLRPNISIQIVPFEAGLYPGAETSHWTILDFPEDGLQPPPTVYAQEASGTHVMDREADVARMVNAFDVISNRALNIEDSRTHLERAIARLKH